jgi:uncharacterized membrane-anchored protein YhcB (DUF1043 family)
MLQTGAERTAEPGAESSGKLLAELREAYRRLPQHIQVCVVSLLRESTLQKQSCDNRAS